MLYYRSLLICTHKESMRIVYLIIYFNVCDVGNFKVYQTVLLQMKSYFDLHDCIYNK